MQVKDSQRRVFALRFDCFIKLNNSKLISICLAFSVRSNKALPRDSSYTFTGLRDQKLVQTCNTAKVQCTETSFKMAQSGLR